MDASTAHPAAAEREFDLQLAALTLEDEYPDVPADVIAKNLASACGDMNAARSSLEELTHAPPDLPSESSQHRNWWPAWPETQLNDNVAKAQQELSHVDDDDAIDSVCQALESAFYPLDAYTIRAVLEARSMDVPGTMETLRELLGPEGVIDEELVIAILQNVAPKHATTESQMHHKARPETTLPQCPAPAPVPVPALTSQQDVSKEDASSVSSHVLAVAELAEFFPALPQSAVSLALARNGGDVHAASETLLKMHASTPSTMQEHVLDGNSASLSAPTSPTPEQAVQRVIRVPSTASRSLPASPHLGRNVNKDGNTGRDAAMQKGFVLGQSNASFTPLTFKPSVPVPFRVAAHSGLKNKALPPPPATAFPPLIVGDTVARLATYGHMDSVNELVAYVDDQDAGFSTKIGELQEYFPVLPLDIVESALAAHQGNIQAASEALAELIDEEGTITHWSEVSKSYVDMAKLHQEDADIAAAVAASLADAESSRVRQYIMKEQARLQAIEEERWRSGHAKDQLQENKHVHPKSTMNDFYVWQTVKTKGSSRNTECDPATALMRKALSPPQEYWRQAGLARQARNAYYKRANAAYDGGDTALAGQLSAKGREHDERYRELMGIAQQSAFINNNSQLGNLVKLDLHGLTVAEALDTLEKYLDKLSCLGATMTLSVITGVGKHSVNGRARILPSVLNFLKDHQMKWFMPQAGVVNILINQEPPGYR
eukprot:jgi/Chlat1/8574/Chrsp82S09231